ncbi:MAG: LysM peptidoglycan-binding domain-containing protein [Verrucomicrobiales bacterium]
MRTRMIFVGITCLGVACAAPDPVAALRRQVEEQERQIRRLEVENSRLRYMLTEVDRLEGDLLYGTKVEIGAEGGKQDVKSESRIMPEDEEGHQGAAYVVKKGDTLSEIAAAKGVELEGLLRLNPGVEPSALRVGQTLRLPQVASLKTSPSWVVPTEPSSSRRSVGHVVAAGENLYRLALRYELPLEELLAANPEIDPRRLRVGQRVTIPLPEPTMLAGGG